MDILTSGQLIWNINNVSLNDYDVLLDERPIRPADLNLFNLPIYLKTPNLVLYLSPATNSEEERVEFPTGPIVTALQILGAIHTYYTLPVTEAELNQMEARGDEMILDVLEEIRKDRDEGKTILRSALMSTDIYLEGIKENPDGSFVVILEPNE